MIASDLYLAHRGRVYYYLRRAFFFCIALISTSSSMQLLREARRKVKILLWREALIANLPRL